MYVFYLNVHEVSNATAWVRILKESNYMMMIYVSLFL